jgi:3'-phosphoadenosine 5'-phosphosulfate sulfotransferase (PAPS reductase)/FAD synthetase
MLQRAQDRGAEASARPLRLRRAAARDPARRARRARQGTLLLAAQPRFHLERWWSAELDIWRYVEREGVPVNPLYFARGGKRFRSIGCVPCCGPIDSNAATVTEIVADLEASKEPERAGRAQDKEHAYTMQKLRALGYM